jgi:hypothetical protein
MVAGIKLRDITEETVFKFIIIIGSTALAGPWPPLEVS